MHKPKQWIWFRGLVRWKIHWGDFEKEFLKVFPGDTVQMIDFPGLGEFYNQNSLVDLDSLLDHIDRQVQGKGPFQILAFSLGAMIAAQWARRHPDRVERLFLINTSDSRSPFYQRFQPQNWWTLLTHFGSPKAEKIEPAILKMTSNNELRSQPYREPFIRAYHNTPFSRKTLVHQLHLASQARFPEVAPVATVFLNSLGDRLVHPKCSERLAQLWNSPLETHPNAGHDLVLDDPAWVLQKLQAYRD